MTATFNAGPSMTTPRSGHTATVLGDGKILVAGGDAFGSAELYNPLTQSFSLLAASLNTARRLHSAIVAGTGQVLIIGGVDAHNAVLNTAEVYDPAWQTFYLPPTDMQTPRALATLKLLPDGKVQIIGGDAELSMEVFDPRDGIFIAKAFLPPNADLLGATLSTQSRAALFSPLVLQDPLLQGVMTPEQSVLLDRADQSITELPSRNQVLVAGGINSTGQILNSAKLVSSSKASVTTDKTDYAPGQIVTITGSGFQPNETVDIYFHEFPEEYPDIFLSTTATQQGSFVTAEFAPQDIDLGRVFTLTAIGQSSGFVAQTAFKDNHTMAVSCSPNSVSTGSLTTCTGTIGSGTGGQPASGRTVTFTSNGAGVFSSTTCLTSGTNATASCSVTYTPSAVGTGTHRITGSFSFTGGHTNSNFFDVTVAAACTAPAITTNPTNQTVTYGQNANFSVAASGNPPPTVQWQVSLDSGANWSNISGVTNTTLTVTAPTVVSPFRRYRAIFTNNCGGPATATTTAATLTVNKAELTVTADANAGTATVDAFSKTYDGAVFSGFTVRYGGFVSGETAAVLGGTLNFSGVGTTAVNVGNGYVVTPGGLTSNNYNITFVDGLLNITKAVANCTVTGFTGPYDRRGENGITAQKVDLDLHRIPHPPHDVDVIPAFLVVPAWRVVVDPNDVRKVLVEVGIQFGLKDGVQHTQLRLFLGLE
jgi:hypothetical protein